MAKFQPTPLPLGPPPRPLSQMHRYELAVSVCWKVSHAEMAAWPKWRKDQFFRGLRIAACARDGKPSQ